MWTEKKLKEAAREYEKRQFLVWEKDMLYHAFLAGCKYIINNTQKEVEK